MRITEDIEEQIMACLNYIFKAFIWKLVHKVPEIKLVVSSPQSNGTVDSDKLVSAQHTWAILSIGATDSPDFAFTNSVGKYALQDYILSVN